MPSSVFQQLNNSSNSNFNNNFFQNPTDLISQFNEFRRTFTGNPQQMVQQLLQNGRMSQADFNRFGKMATEFQKLLYKN